MKDATAGRRLRAVPVELDFADDGTPWLVWIERRPRRDVPGRRALVAPGGRN